MYGGRNGRLYLKKNHYASSSGTTRGRTRLPLRVKPRAAYDTDVLVIESRKSEPIGR